MNLFTRTKPYISAISSLWNVIRPNTRTMLKESSILSVPWSTTNFFILKNFSPNPVQPISNFRSFHCSSLSTINNGTIYSAISRKNLVALPICLNQTRSIIKWSRRRGRRKTDKNVIKRFKRLDWGIWIRPIAGAERQLWRKSGKRINRIKQNVFCSSSQSRKLDKMVTNFWKRPRVYPDDPYKPYLKRENFRLSRSQPEEIF